MKQSDSFDVITFTQDLLAEYGLDEWTVGWDRAKRRAGCCLHGQKRITFSKFLAELYSAEVMMNVAKHELAHALAGPAHKHDAHWKAIARSVGAEPRALLPAHLPGPAATWVGTCRTCGMQKDLYSSPRRVVSCGICSPTFNDTLILEWRFRGVLRTPAGKYAQELRRIERRRRSLTG